MGVFMLGSSCFTGDFTLTCMSSDITTHTHTHTRVFIMHAPHFCQGLFSQSHPDSLKIRRNYFCDHAINRPIKNLQKQYCLATNQKELPLSCNQWFGFPHRCNLKIRSKSTETDRQPDRSPSVGILCEQEAGRPRSNYPLSAAFMDRK